MTQSSGSDPKKRLVVIDDEPALRDYVRVVAEQVGYEVQAAAHAKEFMAMMEAGAPDVVVLDIVMPDIDGIELIRWLGARRCRAKVVILTGYNPHYADMAGAIGKDLQLDIAAVLTKPVRVAELKRVLA